MKKLNKWEFLRESLTENKCDVLLEKNSITSRAIQEAMERYAIRYHKAIILKTPKKVQIDELLPICQDFSKGWRTLGQYKINLARLNKFVPTGDQWGYAPFEKKYRSLEEAKEARKEILRTILQIFIPK